MRTSFILLFSLISFALGAQVIFLDGETEDWVNPDLVIDDTADNNASLNVDRLELRYDDEYVYIKISFDREILLQQDNDILIGIDFDADPSTGLSHGNIGAEWVFNFGNRNGFLFNGGIILSKHDDVGLIAAPTVSSQVFEIGLRREFRENGFNFKMGDQINVHLSTQGEFGDWASNTGIASVDISESRPLTVPTFQIDQNPMTEFRFMSFNALRDNIFELSVQNDFRRLMHAVNADVYCFQEVYDNDEDDLLSYMLDLNILDNSINWYAAKRGPDLITISKFPIVFDQAIGNNSMQVVNVNGQDVFIVNTHLPCCENDLGREIEIDQILQFIRRAKENTVGYDLALNTPIIICGDMNLVGQASQLEALKSGDIFDNSFFGPDVIMDWDGSGLDDLTAPTTGFPAAFTWYNPSSSFFPGRLDFVLYTGTRLEQLNSFVINTQGLNQSQQIDYQLNDGTSLSVSDHMPVVADFRIRNSVSTSEVNPKIDFNIYPNPSNGSLFIESKVNVNYFEIYNSAGLLLESGNIKNSNEISSNLVAGLYLLRVHFKDGSIQSRQIVFE